MKPKQVRPLPARLAHIGSWQAAVSLSALFLVGAWGCSSDRDRLETPDGEERIDVSGDTENSFLGIIGAQLRLSVDDPDAWYSGREGSPWYQFSTVTHAESFTLRLTNEGRRPVKDIQLLVAVPSNLPEVGWSVTIGNPGIVYTSLSDFNHRLLSDTHYPKILPHNVYWRQGNARFLVVAGPTSLEGGMTWEVPIQLYGGATENFMVHFDAAGVRAFASPILDVTAHPPMLGGGGEFVATGTVTP